MRVPSGAFVARRNGKVFVTGNSGFPKSLDVGKAIDKAAGAEREVVGPDRGRLIGGTGGTSTNHGRGGIAYGIDAPTAPATDAARQWDGWGTALKPSVEMWILARKPLSEPTVAANVLRWGCGALNIDASRIGTGDVTINRFDDGMKPFGHGAGHPYTSHTSTGRWPSNVLFSHVSPGPDGTGGCEEIGTRRVKGITGGGRVTAEGWGWDEGGSRPQHAAADGTEQVSAWRCHPSCPVAELDRQSGAVGGHSVGSDPATYNHKQEGWGNVGMNRKPFDYGDTGGASRFFQTFPPEVPRFRFVAKPSRAEREQGLAPVGGGDGVRHNTHPT